MSSLNRDDIEVYFEVYGSGTPFLFFSETACAGDIWSTYQVPEFSRDHRVITHDYRGTGKSSKPTIQYSCEDFVDDAVAILDHLNAGPTIVLGHSMGGRVAMLMALKYPEKVKKLIVASVVRAFPAHRRSRLRCAKKWLNGDTQNMCGSILSKWVRPRNISSGIPIKWNASCEFA